MSRRTSSSTQPGIRQRPSLATAASASFISARPLDRKPSAISAAERGHDETVTRVDDAIHEEIAEIRRYEVFGFSL